jgi:hypothetical protein
MMNNTNTKRPAVTTFEQAKRAALAMGFNLDVATYYASMRHAGLTALDAYLKL